MITNRLRGASVSETAMGKRTALFGNRVGLRRSGRNTGVSSRTRARVPWRAFTQGARADHRRPPVHGRDPTGVTESPRATFFLHLYHRYAVAIMRGKGPCSATTRVQRTCAAARRGAPLRTAGQWFADDHRLQPATAVVPPRLAAVACSLPRNRNVHTASRSEWHGSAGAWSTGRVAQLRLMPATESSRPPIRWQRLRCAVLTCRRRRRRHAPCAGCARQLPPCPTSTGLQLWRL